VHDVCDRRYTTPFGVDVRPSRTYVSGMTLTATTLRSQLYQVLDRIAETGEPVEIIRKGRRLRIQIAESEPRLFSFEALAAHPGTIIGDPDSLPYVDFSGLWQPDEHL
jgi:hypothetical protein